MALKTKSIKAPREASDGTHISVMRRHTLNDDVTPDEDLHYDEWWPDLGPPSALNGSYYKRGLAWEDLEERFISYLTSPRVQILLQRLIRLSLDSDVTIMCIETTPEKSHRRLIAEACKKINPNLEVVVE